MIQAWYSRHKVFSDGISYLDIASYYARGDWHSALNSYWSPLYSWLLAIIIVVFRPDPYWHVALLHLVNFLAYLAALAGLEAILGGLIRFQQRQIGSAGLSEFTIRITGYVVFLIATLLLIDTAFNSPDMVATAVMMYLIHLLLKIESNTATTATYFLFGIAMALEYLCRAAFAPFVVIYLSIAALLLWQRRLALLRPLAIASLAAFLLAAPFVIALSVSKHRFTIGDSGKLNYGWEIDSAARSIHWQGEPFDIGTPLHPTHKVLDHPAVFTFAEPVPGSYPPWYEPSYWYQGIQPRFKLRPQLSVFVRSMAGVVYLVLRSPVTIPVLILAFFMGWRLWFSQQGLFAYWFLLIPSILYILGYTIVFLDSRYIAGSLVIVWLCLLASVSIRSDKVREFGNKGIQAASVLFAVAFIATRLVEPGLADAGDLVHLHESEWNLNWMVAQRLTQMGLVPGDRVAWIGQAIDAEWARIDHVKIIAEVPVSWDRDTTLFRRTMINRKEVKTFWYASPEQKARVFQAFLDAGATVVVLDRLPNGIDQRGWQRVLPKGTPHVTNGVAQYDIYKNLYFRRLAPPKLSTR